MTVHALVRPASLTAELSPATTEPARNETGPPGDSEGIGVGRAPEAPSLSGHISTAGVTETHMMLRRPSCGVKQIIYQTPAWHVHRCSYLCWPREVPRFRGRGAREGRSRPGPWGEQSHVGEDEGRLQRWLTHTCSDDQVLDVGDIGCGVHRWMSPRLQQSGWRLPTCEAGPGRDHVSDTDSCTARCRLQRPLEGSRGR